MAGFPPNSTGIESKPSSTGARVLSAYRRALARCSSSGLYVPGLNRVQVESPAMIVGPVGPFQQSVSVESPGLVAVQWPVTRNLKYRFSGNGLVNVANPNILSLESAGMGVILGTAASPGFYLDPLTTWTLVNAARLSAQTALAFGSPVSFDNWEIDCSDILVAYPQASFLQLFAFFMINNTSAAPQQIYAKVNFAAAAVQFTDYNFDIWE